MRDRSICLLAWLSLATLKHTKENPHSLTIITAWGVRVNILLNMTLYTFHTVKCGYIRLCKISVCLYCVRSELSYIFDYLLWTLNIYLLIHSCLPCMWGVKITQCWQNFEWALACSIWIEETWSSFAVHPLLIMVAISDGWIICLQERWDI